jgi:hypothetical protein
VFNEHLREQVDLDTLTVELLAVVDQTMQPTQTSLWSCPGSVDTLTLGTGCSLERSSCATNPSALSAGVPR